MLKFKNPKTGVILEVTEEFAEQVLRPQGHYEEIGGEKVSTEIKSEVKSQEVGSTPTTSTKKKRKKVAKKKVRK